MREVQSSEAKAHLTQLLSKVARGESFTITRHGQPIAHLIPIADHRKAQVEKAMEEIAAFRETMPRIAPGDILAARHDGHRH